MTNRSLRMKTRRAEKLHTTVGSLGKALLVVCGLGLALMAWPVVAAPSGSDCETRVLKLEHLDTQAAKMFALSMLQARNVEEDPAARNITVTSTSANLDAMEKLLRTIDVAAPTWEVELVAEGSSGEQVYGGAISRDEPLRIELGDATQGQFQASLAVDSTPGGAAELRLTYDIRLDLVDPDGGRPFHYNEKGKASFIHGDERVLVHPASVELQRALGEVIGVGGAETMLTLRVRARKEDTVRSDSSVASSRPIQRDASECTGDSFDWDRREMRPISVRFLDTASAVATLRLTLQARQIAEDRGSGTIVLHDDRATCAEGAHLLQEIDKRTHRWNADLSLETDAGETHVRPINLDTEASFYLSFGDSSSGDLSVFFDFGESVTSRSLVAFGVHVSVPGGEDRPSFDVKKAGTISLGEASEAVLLEVSDDEVGRSLAKVLGVDGIGSRLILRLQRVS